VTETQWLACDNPTLMIHFLRGKASDRKLRLFACACCRRVWHLLTDERSRQAVETAERFAESSVTAKDLGKARALADRVRSARHDLSTQAWESAARAAFLAAAEDFTTTGTLAVWSSRHAAGMEGADKVWQSAVEAAHAAGVEGRAATQQANFAALDATSVANAREEAVEATLLRDLFGTPFRAAALDPAWLAWNDGTVAKLAAAIYDARRFADLPILADALEDAGCTDAAILAHCREPGEHVRGCWVVDLLLGKS
jgi:hypothetical protein